MNSLPSDQADRDRFIRDWGVNFAVVANAGSGKTTAISRRLAAMARSEAGAEMLKKTAVVTYTKKAAAQIEQSARRELLRQMDEDGERDTAPLARLDKAYFGTIHSFCIVLARRHGSELGIHLNPTLLEDEDDVPWEEFLDQDPMEFTALASYQLDAFLRHASLDDVFELARKLGHQDANHLLRAPVAALPAPPAASALGAILDASTRKGKPSEGLERNKRAAREWVRRFSSETARLALPVPEGTAANIKELFGALVAPLKEWLAAAGGALAAELSLRYRAWRQDRGFVTYSDQVETALTVLGDASMLEKIRAEDWRVILDEAQDTDRSQFSVLVEIARPPGAERGAWPALGGKGPVPGHFCMVGDAQQGIFSARAGIRNFREHVAAFERGDGGERLTFGVTFRSPRRIVRLLNETLPGAFGPGRAHNLGLPIAEGAPAPLLQVDYETLVPGPSNAEGWAWRLPVAAAAVSGTQKVSNRKLANEARQVAERLLSGGPASVGARTWGDVCILAPRRAWLTIIRGEFEAAGLKTALQMRKNRSGDNPVYAWMCGLLAVACDPENQFEWMGVLREVFGISDSSLAAAMRVRGGIRWDEPGDHTGPIGDALSVLGPFITRVDDEGDSLGRFASELSLACGLGAKASVAGPDGGLADELARLLAQADELGLTGAGPRAWLRALLGAIDLDRAPGRPAPNAINMMTSHSAKGLEWPVVIPLGLWRLIGERPETGIRVISEHGVPRVVFDNADMGATARDSRDRERLRGLVRLLYVTLTRAKASLVIPWADGWKAEGESFADLWSLDPMSIDALPQAEPPLPRGAPPGPDRGAGGVAGGGRIDLELLTSAPAEPFPARILPHQLALAHDYTRLALHEASLDEAAPVKDQLDPLDYGIWWHGMLEHVPWAGSGPEVAAYASTALAGAEEKGFRDRGGAEWERLVASGAWSLMRDPRWTALAEVGIFAPLGPGRWIDGVMDLVLNDPVAKEIWIVDWKTNRRAEGEDDVALLARLSAQYLGQLGAYGACASGFFPGSSIRLWVYSTVAGEWAEVPGHG